jgi:signal transduction histidine kinase
MNLAINARDAMPHGGQLTIETANVELDESYARSNKYLPPGSYVMLSFSDNGCGMDADTRARVFDPFFTTKVPGKGTGLGMSTVFGIVKQNSGYIVVESELNSGASFKIYFPPTQDHTLTDASPSRKKRVLPFGLTPCVANPSRPEIS